MIGQLLLLNMSYKGFQMVMSDLNSDDLEGQIKVTWFLNGHNLETEHGRHFISMGHV